MMHFYCVQKANVQCLAAAAYTLNSVLCEIAMRISKN